MQEEALYRYLWVFGYTGVSIRGDVGSGWASPLVLE